MTQFAQAERQDVIVIVDSCAFGLRVVSPEGIDIIRLDKVKRAKLSYLFSLDLLDASSYKIGHVLTVAQLEEIDGSADESEMNAWFDSRCPFEPLEGRGELFKPLIAHGYVVHGYVMVLI